MTWTGDVDPLVYIVLREGEVTLSGLNLPGGSEDSAAWTVLLGTVLLGYRPFQDGTKSVIIRGSKTVFDRGEPLTIAWSREVTRAIVKLFETMLDAQTKQACRKIATKYSNFLPSKPQRLTAKSLVK